MGTFAVAAGQFLLGIWNMIWGLLTSKIAGPVLAVACVMLALNLFCYSVILYAWVGYLRERDWVDAVNATAWLGVCAVLVYQMYVPGDYEGWERRAVNAAKVLAYGTILGCAVWWTIDASNPLDAIDAWLWLVCFAVIELNVFGFEQGGKPVSETMRS